MIRFDREEVVNKTYNVTYEEFMCNYYAGAMLDYEDPNVVLVYVHSGRGTGNMSYVFDVPLIKGCDLDDARDVKQMIVSHSWAERKKKKEFIL